jgi:hypothetical protein
MGERLAESLTTLERTKRDWRSAKRGTPSSPSDTASRSITFAVPSGTISCGIVARRPPWVTGRWEPSWWRRWRISASFAVIRTPGEPLFRPRYPRSRSGSVEIVILPDSMAPSRPRAIAVIRRYSAAQLRGLAWTGAHRAWWSSPEHALARRKLRASRQTGLGVADRGGYDGISCASGPRSIPSPTPGIRSRSRPSPPSFATPRQRPAVPSRATAAALRTSVGSHFDPCEDESCARRTSPPWRTPVGSTKRLGPTILHPRAPSTRGAVPAWTAQVRLLGYFLGK